MRGSMWSGNDANFACDLLCSPTLQWRRLNQLRREELCERYSTGAPPRQRVMRPARPCSWILQRTDEIWSLIQYERTFAGGHGRERMEHGKAWGS